MAKIHLGKKKSDDVKFGGGPTDAGLHEAGHDKTHYPSVYLHDTEPPKGMEVGHKVTLHGKVKEVHTSDRSTDEGKKHSGGMEVEVHHMEHHHEAPKKCKDDEDGECIEKGLDDVSEKKESKKDKKAEGDY